MTFFRRKPIYWSTPLIYSYKRRAHNRFKSIQHTAPLHVPNRTTDSGMKRYTDFINVFATKRSNTTKVYLIPYTQKSIPVAPFRGVTRHVVHFRTPLNIISQVFIVTRESFIRFKSVLRTTVNDYLIELLVCKCFETQTSEYMHMEKNWVNIF